MNGERKRRILAEGIREHFREEVIFDSWLEGCIGDWQKMRREKYISGMKNTKCSE